jgi:heme-degrading monooxygenase HmoA
MPKAATIEPMVFEHAQLSITPGSEVEFERLFDETVRDIFGRAEGFVSIELHRSIERPSVYLMRVCWKTLEAHTVDFRSSDLFAEWRTVAGPFFAEPPSVEHFSPV